MVQGSSGAQGLTLALVPSAMVLIAHDPLDPVPLDPVPLGPP